MPVNFKHQLLFKILKKSPNPLLLLSAHGAPVWGYSHVEGKFAM